MKRIVLSILFSLVAFVCQASDYPFVVNVDDLNCRMMSEQYACKNREADKSVSSEVRSLGCGYFKQGQGPINNRWFDQCDRYFTGEYAKVCVYGRDNRLACGVIDKGVNVMIPLVYNDIRLVEGEDIVAVNYLGKWGYYSLSQNRLLFTPQFSQVSDFGDGLAYVIDADEEATEPAWIINDQGLRVASIPSKITVQGRFTNGLIPAKFEGLWGYLGGKGDWDIEPQFYQVTQFINGNAAVKYQLKPSQWAVINPLGEGTIFLEGLSHSIAIHEDLFELSILNCAQKPNDASVLSSSGLNHAGLNHDPNSFFAECLKMCIDVASFGNSKCHRTSR